MKTLTSGKGGGVVVVEGEPGMGKTALISELEAHCKDPDRDKGSVATFTAKVIANDIDALAAWRPIVMRALLIHLRARDRMSFNGDEAAAGDERMRVRATATTSSQLQPLRPQLLVELPGRLCRPFRLVSGPSRYRI